MMPGRNGGVSGENKGGSKTGALTGQDSCVKLQGRVY